MDGREHRWSLVLANGRLWPKADIRLESVKTTANDPKRPFVGDREVADVGWTKAKVRGR